MKQYLLLLFSLFFLSVGAWAQERAITGRVIEKETGTPLPGVTIRIKNTSQAATTDSDGKFSISANSGQVLVFSFVGYHQQELPVMTKTETANMALEISSNNLAEVVVTGALGIKRPARELGSSAQMVDNEYLNQGKTVNPLLGLSSKVAGLRINMNDSKVDPGVQVTLRGTRSLTRTATIDGRNVNAPLYVVDGMPMPDINRLNPNDIESVTVLKGANAAALYGSDGVNGAIMITTKNGTNGRGTISLSNTTTFSNVYLLPKAQTKYGQGANGVYDPSLYESWGPAFDGTMRDFGTPLPDGSQPQLLYAAPSRDNRLNLFNTGVNVQNDISFSGGDDKSTYFVSAQHVRQTGVIPKDENTRINLRFNGSRDFGRLKTSYNVNFIDNENNVTPDGPWVGAYRMPANFDYDFIKDWENPNSPGNPNNYFTPNGSWVRNPYFLIDNIRNQTNQQIINGKIDLNYTFADWFSALYRVGMYSLNQDTRNTTRKFQTTRANNTNGAIDDGSNNYQRFNSDLMLNFKKEVGDFSARLLLGHNLRTDYRKTHNIGASNLLYPDVLNPGSRTGELTGGVTITEQRSMAVYGELVTGYKNFLYLTFTGRNDWVSTLSPQNRSYFYPGVSAAFVASDAFDFLRDSEKVSFAKFYTSWNRTGNVTLTPYMLNNTYAQANGFPFGTSVGFLPGLTDPNPNIEPEFVTSFEAGFQFGFFNNRLNIDAAYVYSDSDGQISTAPVSRATGYNAALVNSGRLTNNILELSVNTDVIRTPEVRWNVGVNYTYTKNIVKELFGGATSRQNFRQSFAMVGEQFPSLWLSDYERVNDDLDGAVIITSNTNGDPRKKTDNVLLGPLVPPHLMGLFTSFNYKGFTVATQFDSRLGGWMYSEIVPAMYEAGTHPITAAYGREAFVWPNSVVEVTAPVRNEEGQIITPGVYEPNTSVLTSGGGREFWASQGERQRNTAAKSDFLKMRELSVSYSLPASILAKQRFLREVGIGFVATNLFIIRHKDNDLGDPEYLYNSTDGYSSFRQVPPVRSYGFNVNCRF
ncbi:SusC/RagA family TonB-linked outer membrane protein [Pontibacter sp. 13R65]|uniref:SusC/RagA family TonB-linked outer membrane protein n=1 Tax=Pontibacter sp. 13R65 TaxID=3127458 RepID=UPI00301BF7F5